MRTSTKSSKNKTTATVITAEETHPVTYTHEPFGAQLWRWRTQLNLPLCGVALTLDMEVQDVIALEMGWRVAPKSDHTVVKIIAAYYFETQQYKSILESADESRKNGPCDLRPYLGVQGTPFGPGKKLPVYKADGSLVSVDDEEWRSLMKGQSIAKKRNLSAPSRETARDMMRIRRGPVAFTDGYGNEFYISDFLDPEVYTRPDEELEFALDRDTYQPGRSFKQRQTFDCHHEHRRENNRELSSVAELPKAAPITPEASSMPITHPQAQVQVEVQVEAKAQAQVQAQVQVEVQVEAKAQTQVQAQASIAVSQPSQPPKAPQPAAKLPVDDFVRVYVDVKTRTAGKGGLLPQEVIWRDGRHFTVDRILSAMNDAAMETGGVGTRYSCEIKGQRRILCRGHENKWFVECRAAATC